MTKIVYKIGNCLDVTSGVLAHACNTEAVMGSGVAYFLAKKHPGAEKSYIAFLDEIYKKAENHFKEKGLSGDSLENRAIAAARKHSLGCVDFHEVSNDLLVANMITQYLSPDFNGKPTSLEAIEACLLRLDEKLKQRKIEGKSTEVHLPLICAVRGGVDWTITRAMVEVYLTNASSITVWILAQEAEKFEEKGWVHFTSYQEDLL